MSDVGLIFSAIPAAMAEIEAIAKDRQNVQQNFKFRGIDDVYNALHSILAKHKIFTVPEVMECVSSERESKSGTALFYEKLRIKYSFYTTDGSAVDAVVEGVGMDSGDKAANKAMAVAHKYALLQVFCIPTEDEKDPDAQSHEVKSAPRAAAPQATSAPTNLISDAQRSRLFALQKASGKTDIEIKAIIAMFGYGSTKEITKTTYTQICDSIQKGKSGSEPPNNEPLPF